jgi:hypothetical protein
MIGVDNQCFSEVDFESIVVGFRATNGPEGNGLIISVDVFTGVFEIY